METIEVIPLVGPSRKLRLEVALNERVGQLIERVEKEIGVSGAFFKLVGKGRVIDEAAEVGEVVKEVGRTFYFYPEVMGG
ncbi:MAG: hypothetical protein RMJ28_04785 [Nitrososphaerota archaeon]|nr:hypothetical protein [Candidatus Calditenuaceae archaeon]MDW8073535.1 hypothetical protein [Nitrososphaerota archaeon]